MATPPWEPSSPTSDTRDYIRPKHIGLDTSADVFGGNENDRAQVRQFVAMLRKLEPFDA